MEVFWGLVLAVVLISIALNLAMGGRVNLKPAKVRIKTGYRLLDGLLWVGVQAVIITARVIKDGVKATVSGKIGRQGG